MKKTRAVALDIPNIGTHHPASQQVFAWERWLAHQILVLLGRPPVSLVLWNGEEIAVAQGKPVARIVLRRRAALYRLITHPDLHFGDLYSTGGIEVEGELGELLDSVYHSSRSTEGAAVRHWQSRIFTRPRSNGLGDSSGNIHHHYDLSNDFYALWLDREMQYTCAYFPTPAMTLEAAQIAKIDLVCRKLQLRPGERVVEVGCGWGGLARHMARRYGVHVRSYNISHEQILYARARARSEGVDNVAYIEDDYRNITGQYDAFVSVGMLEHVGVEHYRGLGEVMHRALTPEGRGLIHTIGRNRSAPLNAWIERRIFPGARPPTLREMMDIFEPREFSVLDVENLRLHYAKTLEHWLARFDQHTSAVESMFDRNFVRAWRLYLAGSLAAFNSGTLQLFQVVFTRGTNNRLPWSRAHLYQSEGGGHSDQPL
ncbi:MAG: cyclopropane-fatty-acyl-phospholipid synthase [Proteobacteria bacterium]|nr:cyclopropane-fatty-acyl-phospholipid synthase [Pseudomonadota bacterium]